LGLYKHANSTYIDSCKRFLGHFSAFMVNGHVSRLFTLLLKPPITCLRYEVAELRETMRQSSAKEALTLTAADVSALLKAAAERAYPADYLAELERLTVPQLRLALADLAHMMEPVLLARADRIALVVEAMVHLQAGASGGDALNAVGATTVVDLGTGARATAADDFRKFAAAIGAPPRLPGLTAAEQLMHQGAKQLHNLAGSARLGVGLAAVAVSERVWQWMCAHIGNLLSRRDAVVATAALGCFAQDRRDAQLADHLDAMVQPLNSDSAARGLGFGADQAVAVLVPLFSLLHRRQLALLENQ
jgi:hypothetical protein